VTHGICQLSSVPIRAEDADKSEMISQLLFGECFTVIGQSEKWFKITTHYDAYEGWIDKKQCLSITPEELEKITANSDSLSFDLVSPGISNQDHIPILLGSSLPFFDGLSFKLKKEKIIFNGQVLRKNENGPDMSQVRKIAFKYLNAPYLWGGRSPFGIDCSGLTQMVFKLLGIDLPRDAYLQAQSGTIINLINEAKEGDLAFFENPEGRITHVGIILNDGEIIHASGKVRIDKLDHFGIYNTETKKYSHTLRLIKRYI